MSQYENVIKKLKSYGETQAYKIPLYDMTLSKTAALIIEELEVRCKGFQRQRDISLEESMRHKADKEFLLKAMGKLRDISDGLSDKRGCGLFQALNDIKEVLSESQKNLSKSGTYLAIDFLREKHNRDVELTDLLAHLLDRYGDLMTPRDRERIDELTKSEQ